MPRLFIAALLPENIKREISQIVREADDCFYGVKWERVEQIHITLKFIGNVKDEITGKIRGIVKNAAGRFTPIPLLFSHIDAFPDFRNPRVIVLRLAISKELRDLNGEIEDELTGIGIERDKRNFTPHITIGRVKSGFKIKDKVLKSGNIEFLVDHIAVVKSEPGKGGSKYINLGVYKLS